MFIWLKIPMDFSELFFFPSQFLPIFLNKDLAEKRIHLSKSPGRGVVAAPDLRQ